MQDLDHQPYESLGVSDTDLPTSLPGICSSHSKHPAINGSFRKLGLPYFVVLIIFGGPDNKGPTI